MNLPNKLTLLRVVLIPVMIVIYYIKPLRETCMFTVNGTGYLTISNFIMCLIFIIASLTDFLDGYLARKYNQVTTFGKFMDPLADKLLVSSALLVLMSQQAIAAWVVIIIIAREFIVTGIRLLAVEGGKVIAASKLGKYKTFTTMIAIIGLFFKEQGAFIFNQFNTSNIIYFIFNIMMYIALILTVISGLDYFIKNRKIIFESK